MKAIRSQSGLTVANLGFGLHGEEPGSVKQQVHDGDTLLVETKGNFGVRFLGVDAPEISLQLPGKTLFVSLADEKWQAFITSPFQKIKLSDELRAYVEPKCTLQALAQHAEHAQQSEDGLEQLIAEDMKALNQTKDNFQFFMAFGHEVTDGYGRLLGFINRYQESGERPLSYNERMLQKGLVFPYFIWPNINPFLKTASLTAAVIKPNEITKIADTVLKEPRAWVKAARKAKKGVWAGSAPVLESFELRFLSRQSPPVRWMIDLSKDDGIIAPPEKYFTISNPEDRLYVPPEFVPLFVEAGWQRGV